MNNHVINFDDFGYIKDEVHQLTLESFIEIFCSAEDPQSVRVPYGDAMRQVYEWADKAGVASIIVGGSFITNKHDPEDIDILVIFRNRSDIVKVPREIGGSQTIVDFQCLSEDDLELVNAYLQLLGSDRRGVGRGLIQLKLHSSMLTHIKSASKSALFDLAKVSYGYRTRVKKSPPKKLVIPIHGVRSDASWMAKFTFLASNAGWVVAPFMYGFESGVIITDEKRKAQVVNDFRLWLDDVRKNYDGTISIVAHSFGTYIVGRYLEDAGFLSDGFCGIVLAGSILNSEYPWHEVLEFGDVSMVLNTKSDNDQWVSKLPDGWLSVLTDDPLMGRAAVDGFHNKHDRLLESKSNLLDHNNMFYADVMAGLWLPFLELADRQRRQAENATELWPDPNGEIGRQVAGKI
ncbi:DUF6932 family protein [Duganella callida]|uniref:Alpha/beta hydrolase n=1 Tax=Duganella callida TaxID=2561932 RepID=A0A4Y9SEC2_9BURK|nr:nucleotidyltransferase domain-containing protein [Duganella callida]TFW18297.1 hypothetical protein E4L98_18480 [Duganella callida]